MTKQEQIEILERAIPKVNHLNWDGLCFVVGNMVRMRDEFWGDAAHRFFNENGMPLPTPMYDCSGEKNSGYKKLFCWPLTPEGDQQRREFLQSQIDRLRKELTTP